MPNQLTIIAISSLCALIAIPACYQYRFNHGVFYIGLVLFIGIPVFAGIRLRYASRRLAALVLVLLATCPLIYFLTDSIELLNETLRDAYFFAVAVILVFVSTAWLAKSFHVRKWGQIVAATTSTFLASISVWIILFLVMYFE